MGRRVRLWGEKGRWAVIGEDGEGMWGDGGMVDGWEAGASDATIVCLYRGWRCRVEVSGGRC
ncbi:hypothetical protein KS4_32890 [Poriferisphaera corsica]|uniref:Uncharacterized protein n=1 Tax=Poriferisphaera corsica TaxID=2528020 RepID=A0A517YYB6_9BACT|nr:hypothetical protein KS4_32890 [Poriferisphaera corsica]